MSAATSQVCLAEPNSQGFMVKNRAYIELRKSVMIIIPGFGQC